MGSLILFVLGVAAPLAAALAVLWNDERRRTHARIRLDRLAQDNRGLKLALGSKHPGAEALFSFGTEAERREVTQLISQLAHRGTLLECLRGGARAPAQASAGKSAGGGPDLQQAIGEWGPRGVGLALDHLKARLSAIAEMEMIWADPHSNIERDSASMLERSLWVFEPEYMVGEGGVEVDQRFGAIAKPVLGAGLYPGQQSKEGDPTLVVDLKSARVTVGADQQLHAWNNVRELIRGGAIRERDPVDVYVVGGSVDELDGNPRIEGRYRNVRITSYDYGQLIARAKRLTFGLYDELKDSAPFLRRHRDEITAAQQAAADRAATEASAPAEEHEKHEHHGEDERHHTHAAAHAEPAAPVRHVFPPPREAPPRREIPVRRDTPPRQETPADQPRRTEYEGDHVVIGTRKHAGR